MNVFVGEGGTPFSAMSEGKSEKGEYNPHDVFA